MRHIVNVRKSVQTAPFHPLPRHISARAPFTDLEISETMGLRSGVRVRARNGRSTPSDGRL